jgi:hypothetical protein
MKEGVMGRIYTRDEIEQKMFHYVYLSERANKTYKVLEYYHIKRGQWRGLDPISIDVIFNNDPYANLALRDNRWYIDQATMYASVLKTMDDQGLFAAEVR